MKKFVLLLLCFAFFGFTTTVLAQSQWAQLPNVPNEDYNCVWITPNFTIFLGTDQGNIYRSQDSGATWQSTYFNANSGIADIYEQDSLWAVGENGLVLISPDTGSTWFPVTPATTVNLESIFVRQFDSIFYVGRNGIFGQLLNFNHTASALPFTNARMESVHAIGRKLFVAGRDGELAVRNIAGGPWQSINLGPDDNKDIFFTSLDTGFVAGENGIYKTTDTGNTWTFKAGGGSTEINALHFGTSQIGFAVDENGLILKTLDGGDTWVSDTTIGTGELNDVRFANGQFGLAVGDGGVVATHFGTPQLSANFCNASYWVDTSASDAANLYVVNNSVPAFSNLNFSTTFLWTFGDSTTSGAPFPSHTYATFGEYEVCVTITSTDTVSNITCSDTYCDSIGVDSAGNFFKVAGFNLVVIDSSSIGLEEKTEVGFEIFPNPAERYFEVKIPDELGTVSLGIFDFSGRKIFMQEIENQEYIDVSQLSRGSYFLKIKKGGRVYFEKLLLR